jgi:integrase
VTRIPVIRHLKENPPRTGFVEDAEYKLLITHSEELWLRALLAIGYTYGFRESELLSLQASQVNLSERTITLNVGETKSDDGRIVGMTAEVHQLLNQLLIGKGASDFVFTRPDGTRVRDFRGAWWNLCKRAGLGKREKNKDGKERWQGLLFHDLRRSAVRNLVRSGVPERIAMAISGHKTRSVFDRYNIVNPKDMHDAAKLIEEARQQRSATTSATETKTEERSEPMTAGNIQYLQ